jgi:hypothetical protein
MLYGIAEQPPEEPTIRVRMLRTDRATLDGGRTIITLEAGKDYDLPVWLATGYFKSGKADPAEAHEMADLENKRLTTAGLAHGGLVPPGGPFLVGSGDREAHLLLDSAPVVTHADATGNVAEEAAGDAARGADRDEQEAQGDRQAGHARRPRRVRGQQ